MGRLSVSLRKENAQQDGCDTAFKLEVRHYLSEDIVPFRMNSYYFTKKVDDHYIVVREGNGGISDDPESFSYQILGIRHDKAEADEICLEKAREDANSFAESGDLEDLTLEEAVV